MTSKQQTKQKTISLLGTDLTLLPTSIQNQIWRGAVSMARQFDARLMFYPAVRAYHLERTNARSNVLIDLINADYLDGLLIWCGGILETLGKEGEERLLECARSIPLVTIGGALKDHPDISVDNYQGMRTAIEHLIEGHGSRRIGFVRGPIHHPEAEQRCQAYFDTLQAHGVQLVSACGGIQHCPTILSFLSYLCQA